MSNLLCSINWCFVSVDKVMILYFCSYAIAKIQNHTDDRVCDCTSVRLYDSIITNTHKHIVVQLQKYIDTNSHKYSKTQLCNSAITQSHKYIKTQPQNRFVVYLHSYAVDKLKNHVI